MQTKDLNRGCCDGGMNRVRCNDVRIDSTLRRVEEGLGIVQPRSRVGDRAG